jgi:hypothetical protein
MVSRPPPFYDHWPAYDYLLSGKGNCAADRAAAEAWREIDPDSVFGARADQAFLGRAVRSLVQASIAS